jgi:hypothetical protein
MRLIKLLVLASSLVSLSLIACGPGGPGSGAPVNCKLAGFTYPDGGATPVDTCPSDRICAQLADADGGNVTLPICVKSVACGTLTCGSGKCGDAEEMSPSHASCLK